ncbi:translocation/assembly module TamB domain-containing protein [Alkalilimnicola ehrlichii]|uniref:translocation/assembly module TamB domain-containing protein n=1 Tax=Alkalilimnicola ehrlichii TaxID=351052 RepID=UPI0015F28E1C|nr:translocation/assembly module TamB domain-containing protein [Alkalilimnicola ehrlichii]
MLSQDGEAALELGYQTFGVQARLDAEGLVSRLNLESDALGRAEVALRAEPDGERYRLGGDVSLDGLQVAIVRPLLPDIQRLEGVIDANGRLGGTLDEPRFTGEIRLQDGAVAAPELPMQLDGIAVAAQIDGTRAELEGQFRSGRGEGRLSGNADWADLADWRVNVELQGERLEAVYQPIASLEVSPDLAVAIRPRAVRVTGRVNVPRGNVTLQDLPSQAVPVSRDVVIVRRPEDDEPDTDEVDSPWRITADIQVVLGRNVQLSGFGVRGRLAGSLRLRQEADGVPEGFGEIRVEDGRYEAYGQRLTIREGRLIFAGPVTEPELSIEAVRVVETVTAGIRVAGQPEDPRAELFSEPAMPQEDILSYIIRGRPLAEAGPGGGAALTQAALALGALGGQELAGGVAEQLGVEDLALDVEGEGDEAQFLVSGYLAPNLFLRYGVGVFEPVQQLTIRYHLSPRVYVEALRGVENALDLFFTREF